jgi:hypothetical protein
MLVRAKFRSLMQRPGIDQIAWAVTPLALVYLSILAGWGWHAANWPKFMNLPPTFIVVLGALAVGVVTGLRRGTPPWAYTWLAQGLYAISLVTGTILSLTILPSSGLVSGEVQAFFLLSNQGFNQFLVFVALVISLLLSKRSRQDSFFFFLLFLGARSVTFPVRLPENLPVASEFVVGTLAVIALIECVAIAVLVYQFLTGDPNSRKMIWWMLGIVFLDPLLKLWPIMIQDEQLNTNLIDFGSALGITSLYTVGFLAAAHISVWIYQRRRIEKR